MINSVVLVGRMAREPETRYSQSGTGVTNFSIAVDRNRKVAGQPDVDFFNCTAFGKTGEFVQGYLDKGARVGITGRLQARSWEKDGRKQTVVEIVAEQVQSLETRAEAEQRRGGARAAPQAPQTQGGGYSAPAQGAAPQGDDPWEDQ